jgi:multidrug transporter EmrE-like cation transporter
MKAGEFVLILTGVLLNAAAQLLLKAGARSLAGIDFVLANGTLIAGRIAQSPAILVGLVCYAISVVVWILALASVEVSVAYPMLSIGYVVNALAAWWLFGENVTLMRVAGMLVIITGVWLVAKS